jgi:hypothetical protein
MTVADYRRSAHGANAQPMQEIKPETMQWVVRLPVDLRPTALRDFPHVLNKLAELWSDDEACGTYLESLLLDDRGGRQGFPPAALSELIALNLHNHGSIGAAGQKPAVKAEPESTSYETIQYTWDDTER